jgi:hypothetical protein
LRIAINPTNKWTKILISAIQVCLFGLPILGTLFWASAFEHIYSQKLTRVQATDWIYSHIPGKTTIEMQQRPTVIVQETNWDDFLPLNLVDKHRSQYNADQYLDLYKPDDEVKRSNMLALLNQADYLVISSNRQWGSLGRLEVAFPLTNAYYRLLLGCPEDLSVLQCYRQAEPGQVGELSFVLEQVFRSEPELFGWTIDSQTAEESFTVYDHPVVMIFRKTADFDAFKVGKLLFQVTLQPVKLTPWALEHAGVNQDY